MRDIRSEGEIARTITRVVRELADCKDWETVAVGLVEKLPLIVAGENPTYNEVVLPSVEVSATLMHDHYMDEAIRTLPAYNHYAEEHPLLSIGGFADSIGRVVSFSQYLPLQDVEKNSVYNEALKYTDARDQILFSLIVGQDRFVSICQNRLQWGYGHNEIRNMTNFARQIIPFLQNKYNAIQDQARLGLIVEQLAEITGCRKIDLLQISPAEIRVARELTLGCSYKEIAAILGVSTRTVAAHSGRLLEKLHLDNRHQLGAAFVAAIPTVLGASGT